jgi:carbonic anhydrase
VNQKAIEALRLLEEGNQRFRTGQSAGYRYRSDEIREIGDGQKPFAAVIACVDGRVTPEIMFDQRMANLFVSRVPGNVASDSAKWMLELAVSSMHVPLVVVMGHTNCLAIGQVMRNEPGAGGSLRDDVARAIAKADLTNADDPYREAIRANARHTVEELKLESAAAREAIAAGELTIVTAVYDVHTGQVEWLDEAKDVLSS